MADKPKTQKETLDQLWYAVIGTNGDGCLGRMKRLEDAFHGKNGNGKKHHRMEVLAVVIAATVMLQSIGLLDGIRVAINQWMSGG